MPLFCLTVSLVDPHFAGTKRSKPAPGLAWKNPTVMVGLQDITSLPLVGDSHAQIASRDSGRARLG